jgi:hypothetical protein
MVTNVFFATTILFLALGFFLLQEFAFLIPFRALLLNKYGPLIAAYSGALFFNLFALTYLFVRKLFLKETGRKLAHVEKQLRAGDSISEELSKRLSE